MHRHGPRGRLPAGRGGSDIRLRTRLLIALAYVLLLAIVALGIPLATSLAARVNSEVRSQAQGQAELIAATAADLLGPSQRAALDALVTRSAASLRGRVLVVDSSGAVLADSAGPGQLGTSYAARPEIADALHGRSLQAARRSNTLRERILATAVPVIRAGAVVGAVRVTQSISAVNAAVRRALLGLALIGAVVLGVGLAAGAVIARQVARPLLRLERTARLVAGGDLEARAAVEGSREQRSLSRSFNEMTERLARLVRSQRDFVADASHQLRTPLTGLRLRLEEAREDDAGPRAAAELEAAIGEVDRLDRIVDELLVLSRAGEHELPAQEVSLGGVAEHAAERWSAAAAERGIELAAERNGTPGTVLAAPADVERALDALIENALRYAPAGSAVTLVADAGAIAVLDRGPGLADDEQELVFERFHRGSAGRKGAPGTGLGLSIARALARSWGGEVTLRNRAGGGARATLSGSPR